jgi:ribosomal protein S18 acetylase RimI-like enzyme
MSNVSLQGNGMRVKVVSEPQHESLIDLLCELHTYYNEGSMVPRETVREHLLENLLGAASPHRLVVAGSESGEVVGLAAITLVYSLVEPTAEKRKHCQLKELYVRSSARSQGVGRALMSWVARYAFENGCCRIDWPVKASNARGISFYEGLGAERVIERLSYRLSEPSMSKLGRESKAQHLEANPSIERTSSSWLRQLPSAAHVER